MKLYEWQLELKMDQSEKGLNRVSQEIVMKREAKLFVHCWIAYHLKQIILFNSSIIWQVIVRILDY